MHADVPGTHMAPETHSRDTALLLDHSCRDCDAPDQNAPHLDDLRHPRDSRTDCDSARQRPARPARDRLRLGSRTPTVGRTAYISPSSAIYSHTTRAPYIRIWVANGAPPYHFDLYPHAALMCLARISHRKFAHETPLRS